MTESPLRDRLVALLQKLEADPAVHKFPDGTFRIWAIETASALSEGFGNRSEEAVTFSRLALGLPLPLNVVTPGFHYGDYESLFDQRKREIKELLALYIRRLEAGVRPNKRQNDSASAAPRIFVAHGGRHSTLDRTLRFLRALGLRPVVVEDEASLDMTTSQKVAHYLEGCDCALILATADDSIGDGKQPRGNVLEEAGRIQERFPGRTIWLKEEGAVLPSNVSAKVYQPFAADNLEQVFAYIAQELNAMNVVRAQIPMNAHDQV